MAFIVEIQELRFTNIQFREFYQSEPGRETEFFVYFHPVG